MLGYFNSDETVSGVQFLHFDEKIQYFNCTIFQYKYNCMYSRKDL